MSWEPDAAKRRQAALQEMPEPREDEQAGVTLWVLHGDITELPDRFMEIMLWWERADTCLGNFHRLVERAKQE